MTADSYISGITIDDRIEDQKMPKPWQINNPWSRFERGLHPLHGYTLCVLNTAGVAFEKKGPKLKC